MAKTALFYTFLQPLPYILPLLAIAGKRIHVDAGLF